MLTPRFARVWSAEGHRAVAEIAADWLNASAKAPVRLFLKQQHRIEPDISISLQDERHILGSAAGSEHVSRNNLERLPRDFVDSFDGMQGM